nr:reverse transcriptase domain-containing protein [Tanacetum cinerariifolium]
MEASAIVISSDSSNESVGSPPFWVILFGDIPTVIPSTSVISLETYAIAPVISSPAHVVEMTIVASPTGLCGLVPYLDSDSNSPDKMDSLEYITPLPATLPFLYTDSFEASDSSDGPPMQDLYAIIIARWRSRVTTRQPYRTRPNGPRRVMTARKRVGPLLARRLSWRRVAPCSLDHCLSSSSIPTDSLPVHSSSLDAPDQTHSGSSTRVVSPRLGYPPVRALRHSEASRRWCAAPLSTPSRKRCRSPTDYVPSSTPVMGSLAPTHADLLPPRKRFRDSYSSETSMEEDTEIDTAKTKDGRELDIVDGDDVRDHIEVDPRDDREEFEAISGDTVVLGIDSRSVPMVDEEIVEPVGGDSSSSSGTRDGTFRSVEDIPVDLDGVLRYFYHHMSEVCVDRIVMIEATQIQLEVDKLIASRERARITKRIESLRLENLKIRDDSGDLKMRWRRTMTKTRSGMTPAAIEEMINRRVAESLEAHEINKNLGLENLNGNYNDGNGNENGNGNGGNGNGNGGNGNGQGGNGNGDGRGTEGVVGLIRWFEKIEIVFHISNCPKRYQVKYATCTLLDSALTWWNSHKRTIGTDAAYALSWRELMKLMTKVYCPINKIQKMETEL